MKNGGNIFETGDLVTLRPEAELIELGHYDTAFMSDEWRAVHGWKYYGIYRNSYRDLAELCPVRVCKVGSSLLSMTLEVSKGILDGFWWPMSAFVPFDKDAGDDLAPPDDLFASLLS